MGNITEGYLKSQITTTVYKFFMTTVISYIGFIGVFTIATISVYLTFLKVKLI